MRFTLRNTLFQRLRTRFFEFTYFIIIGKKREASSTVEKSLPLHFFADALVPNKQFPVRKIQMEKSEGG